jgi:hypothetical protein
LTLRFLAGASGFTEASMSFWMKSFWLSSTCLAKLGTILGQTVRQRRDGLLDVLDDGVLQLDDHVERLGLVVTGLGLSLFDGGHCFFSFRGVNL